MQSEDPPACIHSFKSFSNEHTNQSLHSFIHSFMPFSSALSPLHSASREKNKKRLPTRTKKERTFINQRTQLLFHPRFRFRRPSRSSLLSLSFSPSWCNPLSFLTFTPFHTHAFIKDRQTHTHTYADVHRRPSSECTPACLSHLGPLLHNPDRPRQALREPSQTESKQVREGGGR